MHIHSLGHQDLTLPLTPSAAYKICSYVRYLGCGFDFAFICCAHILFCINYNTSFSHLNSYKSILEEAFGMAKMKIQGVNKVCFSSKKISITAEKAVYCRHQEEGWELCHKGFVRCGSILILLDEKPFSKIRVGNESISTKVEECWLQ